MELPNEQIERLSFLARVVMKEVQYLQYSDNQVFAEDFTPQRAKQLVHDQELALQVEAFVSRFGRLQDMVADKLLPQWLKSLGEKMGPVIDNLRLAERLGVLSDAEKWLELRYLRNQMVHEYIEDPIVLSQALQSAHDDLEMLIQTAKNIVKNMQDRGWIISNSAIEPLL